jgi:iron complex outermembrane receptor protein
VRVPLWTNGAFVANYTHATRAPALEELYNNGPHPGNLTFEVGNALLDHEVSDGIDLSVRHRSDRVRAEVNGFYYWIGNYVFLAPTGNIEDGLIEAEYLQANAAYRGMEGSLGVMLQRHVWLNLGMDLVDAKLREPVTSSTGVTTAEDTPLPRIPPLRGRVGLDLRVGGLSVKPEVLMVKDQDEIFPTETRTAGYTLVNLGATYTLPRQHTTHIFTVEAFNLGDRLYRNHLSFIKELAPEIGRGVRFGYTLRFF